MSHQASTLPNQADPVMPKIDFGGLRGMAQKPRGVLITLVVNWLIAPFSIARLGWLWPKRIR